MLIFRTEGIFISCWPTFESQNSINVQICVYCFDVWVKNMSHVICICQCWQSLVCFFKNIYYYLREKWEEREVMGFFLFCLFVLCLLALFWFVYALWWKKGACILQLLELKIDRKKKVFLKKSSSSSVGSENQSLQHYVDELVGVIADVLHRPITPCSKIWGDLLSHEIKTQ